jgi:hypothetical protein
VRRFRNLDEYEASHVLFVAESKARRIDVIRDFLGSLERRAVLTVGEHEDFARRGGLIRLIDRAEGVGFEIDAEAARHAGLTIGAELLALEEPRRAEPAKAPR